MLYTTRVAFTDLCGIITGDQTVCIWDRRTALPQFSIPAHQAEVLTCDWNKYDQV
mgnify:CR=1 FL=1